MAPARIVVLSTIDRPRKMYSPSPPAPIAAAIVAVPTPITVATRRPATIDGSASGSSTMNSSCRGVMPMATPASTTRRVEALQPSDRRADDRQQRVERERHQRGARSDPADERERQQEAEQRQAGNRLRDVGDKQERPAEPRPAKRQNAGGNSEQRGHAGRDQRPARRAVRSAARARSGASARNAAARS